MTTGETEAHGVSLSLCTFTFFCGLKIIRSFRLKKEKRRKGVNEGFEKKIKKKSSLTLKWEAHPNIPALIWSPLWGSLSKPKGPSAPRAGLPASASADRPSGVVYLLINCHGGRGVPFPHPWVNDSVQLCRGQLDLSCQNSFQRRLSP